MGYFLLLLVLLFSLGTWLTEILILSPLNLFKSLNHPLQLSGILALVLFAWCFGD